MSEVEKIKVWYDKAGNYLDVFWVSKAGNFFMPTADDRVEVLVDDAGNLSGFMIWGLSRVKDQELVNADLTPVEVDAETARPEPAAAVYPPPYPQAQQER